MLAMVVGGKPVQRIMVLGERWVHPLLESVQPGSWQDVVTPPNHCNATTSNIDVGAGAGARTRVCKAMAVAGRRRDVVDDRREATVCKQD